MGRHRRAVAFITPHRTGSFDPTPRRRDRKNPSLSADPLAFSLEDMAKAVKDVTVALENGMKFIATLADGSKEARKRLNTIQAHSWRPHQVRRAQNEAQTELLKAQLSAGIGGAALFAQFPVATYEVVDDATV